MKKLLFTLSFVLMGGLAAFANGLTPYVWTPYNLSFKVPGGANILKSTNEEFVVDNDQYNVQISVIQLPLDEDDMSNFLLQKAGREGMDMDDAEVQEFSNTGVHGVSLEGSRNGGKDQMCAAVLVTDDAGTFIFISIVYANGLEQEVTDMINSFVVK